MPADLPTTLTSNEVAAVMRQSLFTTQRKLRTGEIPGVKLSGGRWRVRRDVVEAILAGTLG
jgi:excisionase family DNA binding protein